mmetsp:Transcript_113258/g.320549  ORF Transcript_113258/g.320549 Transcript_113258/m.320549 type:complete len:453 (-) Transcript_113258:2-1360(-)
MASASGRGLHSNVLPCGRCEGLCHGTRCSPHTLKMRRLLAPMPAIVLGGFPSAPVAVDVARGGELSAHLAAAAAVMGEAASALLISFVAVRRYYSPRKRLRPRRSRRTRGCWLTACMASAQKRHEQSPGSDHRRLLGALKDAFAGASSRDSPQILPNSGDAAFAIKRRRQIMREQRSSEDIENSKGVAQALPPRVLQPRKIDRAIEDSASAKSLPTRVATWHAWFKGMSAKSFFGKVSRHPEILQAYTRMARLEAVAGPDDNVLRQAASLLHNLLLGMPATGPNAQVVDLGCGEGGLASELAAMHWHAHRSPEVTSVDAASLAPHVKVHNIAKLPARWEGRFDAAVLCRALWGRDYPKVLSEARRILKVSEHSRLLVVEPFRRWWGRDKEQPRSNALLPALRQAGFDVDLDRSVDTEPRPAEAGDRSPGTEVGPRMHRMEGVFQYIVAGLQI